MPCLPWTQTRPSGPLQSRRSRFFRRTGTPAGISRRHLRLTEGVAMGMVRDVFFQTGKTMKIHHLNCGTLCPYCEKLINGKGSLLKPARLVCHCLLVESSEGLILVDTGFGTEDVQQPERRLGKGFMTAMRPTLSRTETARVQLDQRNLDAKDVRHIIPTHLDLDHAGGLSDFPEAAIHVMAKELAQITHPDVRDRIRFRQAQFVHHPQWAVHQDTHENWFGMPAISPIPELKDSLKLVPLPGHTKGHMGVAVRGENKWLLHCGDAYFHRGQIHGSPEMPKALELFEQAIQTIPQQRRDSLTRLQELAQRHGDEVDIFCAHDPVEFDRLAGNPSA